MPTDTDMQERHGRVLAELAEAGMVMVRQLSAAMLAAPDAQTQAQLGLAFHRVSRTVRQTLALEFRLAQDLRREERPTPARPTATTPSATTQAPTPRPPRERAGWDEYEPDDADETLDELDALLKAEDLDRDAVHEAVETCIARIRADLDTELPVIGKARLSSPAGGGGPAEGRWRGTAPSAAYPANPHHPAAKGPPPAKGEENPGQGSALLMRPPPGAPARRSALLNSSSAARPPPAPRQTSA